MERHQRVQLKTTGRSTDRSFKVSPVQTHGFGVQQKAAESTPASKAELWENYQRSTQLTRKGSNTAVAAPEQTRSPIQAKLTIGQPGDKYEQEADSVADRVMSMSEPTQVQREESPEEEELQMKPLAQTISPLLQREAMPEEELQMKPEENVVQREELPEEEELQMKSLDNSIQREELPEEELQMKQSSSNAQTATPSLENQLSSSKGGGNPLSDDVRSFMDTRFGADFSGVRVHTGNDAVQMNRDVNAQAFAYGQDIYFGAGKAPGKDALTAHELTHVVQQTDVVQRQCQDCEDSIQRDISTPLPSGVTPDKKSGNASFQDGSFKVRILPDGKKKSQGAETTIKYNWGSLSYKTKGGIVTSFKGPGNPSVTIQTLYGSQLSATSTSGYGKGTASGDSDTSLGFHEGSHGKDFLSFMSQVPVRGFLGITGMTVADFKTELEQWKQGCQQYSQMLQMFTERNTDCVGKTIDRYNASQGKITNICPYLTTKTP